MGIDGILRRLCNDLCCSLYDAGALQSAALAAPLSQSIRFNGPLKVVNILIR